jgi:hypothetical protein
VSHRRATALGAAFAAVIAVLLASGCQSRLGVAALVGDQRITDDQLHSLVQDALAAPGVRDALQNSSYKGDLAQYRRGVLDIEVRRALAEAAASKLGIAVTDSDVAERYRFYQDNNGGAAQFPAQLASKVALTPALFRESVRAEVIAAEVGYRTGGVKRPSEAELRSRYEPYAVQQTKAMLGLIQVPDEATAQSVLARVQRNPDSFATVAKEFATAGGPPAEPQGYPVSDLPPDLNAKIAKAKPGDVLTFTGAGNGAQVIYVIKFAGMQRPTYEASRPQLLSESVGQAIQAGQRYILTLANQVGVHINPRYGSWDGKQLTITDFVNPVVKTTPAATGTPAAPGAPPEPTPPGG